LAINSILEGNILPYKIVLTLYKGDIQYISKELQELIDSKKIELLICDEDLGAVKKWYYVMKKYKDNPILTIDDDLIFPKNTLEEVLKYAELYPNTIIGRNGRPLIINSYNQINCFLKTIYDYPFNKIDTEPSYFCHIFGGYGTLYPKNCLKADNMDIEILRKYKQIDEMIAMYYALKNNVKSALIKHNTFDEIATLMKNEDILNSAL
jgi:GT2 family glycosyltransferase